MLRLRIPLRMFTQAGAIPYRETLDGIEILLVTSTRTKSWIVPKGVIEPNWTAADTASKEAKEEAGVIGQLRSSPVGTYQYEKWGGVCSVSMFPLAVETVLEDWPEAKKRQRQWFPLNEAITVVGDEGIRRVLTELENQFRS